MLKFGLKTSELEQKLCFKKHIFDGTLFDTHFFPSIETEKKFVKFLILIGCSDKICFPQKDDKLKG